MTDKFQEWQPTGKSEDLIDHINTILDDFRSQGYTLTLRQLYYQLVARDLIPNTDRSYKMIGNVVSRGRMAGLIDWSMIEDRVRIPKSNSHWDSPQQIITAAAKSYYRSRWATQEHYIEVWCEKDAVSNIILPVCQKYDVTFMANRGYSSQSALYESADRFKDGHFNGKSLSLLYLGDHDPSGIDMTRDVRERMELFLGWREFVAEENIDISVYRLALNMDQVKKYGPPENPAKITDSRFEGYVIQYGAKSWELDALEPRVLAKLVEDSIVDFIDQDAWDDVEDIEDDHRKGLMKVADDWED